MLKNDEGGELDDELGGRGDKMKDESPRIAGIIRRFWVHEFYVSCQSMEFVLKDTCDTRDTWRMVSGVSHVSRGFLSHANLGIYGICLKRYM